MARAVVTAGLVTWSIAGVVAIGIGVAGAGWLYERLPTLTIDVGAVGGAATFLGVGMLATAVAHLVVVLNQARPDGTAGAGAIVMCAIMAVALLALAAAAATTASVSTEPWPLLLAMSALGLGSLGYLCAAAALIRDRARIGPWEAD